MENKDKKPKSWLVAIASVILALAGFGGYQATFGSDDGDSGMKFNIYGSSSGTTAVTSTSKILYIGSSNNTMNINIKASSTHTQTIAFYPEFSNDASCTTTSTWFREDSNTLSGVTVTATTTSYSLAIPVGLSYNNIQLSNLNTECVKLTFVGSAVNTTSMVWIEGIVK